MAEAERRGGGDWADGEERADGGKGASSSSAHATAEATFPFSLSLHELCSILLLSVFVLG